MLCVSGAISVCAQRSLQGTITDGTEPLIGATLLVKGTTKGAITDFEGKFAMTVSDEAETLVVSYTGYQTTEIAIGNQTQLDIVLQESEITLGEVVVTALGVEREKKALGYAVQDVDAAELAKARSTNVVNGLSGRVAGIQITAANTPGGGSQVTIRGNASILGNNQPLYVIDGVPMEGDFAAPITNADDNNVYGGGISEISPDNIESITVLKGANAAALYGSRAANGVILITTKRGEKGESKISYNTYYATQSLPNELDMMDLRQFADYQIQIAGDLNITPNQRYLDPSLLGAGTNWQNEVFRDAGMQSHQVSITGGTDKTNYAVSGGFFQQDGIIIGSNFDRFTTRINLDNQVKDWIKVGGSLAYANTDERITLNDGGDGVIMQALTMQPDVPVRDINGNYAGPDVSVGGASYNPVAAALQRNNTMTRQRLMANLYADATLYRSLTFRTEIGFDDNHSLNKAFHPTYKWGALENTENQLRQREESNFFWIWKNYLTYNVTLGEAHGLTAMIGTEAQKSSWEGSQVTKKNFSSNDIQVLSEGDDITSRTSGWKDAASIASYFGRFNYSFDNRYLLTLTLRADGSSKFGPANKWGYFPSGSFAWRISQEKFMDALDGVSDLKLRIGYGEVGNQAIANYLYGSSLLTLNTPFGTAYRLEKIANPNLKWEATKQFNLGVDLSLWGGRVDFTVDVYNKQTDDMLLQLSIPSYLGGSSWNDIRAPFANVGKMENKGIDLALTSRNIRNKKFAWDTDLTFSLNRNEVKELDDEGKIYWRNL